MTSILRGILLLTLGTQLAVADPPASTSDGGAIAYTNGAFDASGSVFVWARLPAAPKAGCEILSIDVATGEIRSLGVVPLLREEPAGQAFRWSLGVLGVSAELDGKEPLSSVFLAQYGPDTKLAGKDAVTWNPTAGRAIPAQVPLQAAVESEEVIAHLAEMDEAAAAARKAYLAPDDLLLRVGKKHLTLNDAKPIDATEAYRGLYAKAVAYYPANRLGMDSGKLLASESVEVLGTSGPWTWLAAEVYVHYGVRGFGYRRILAADKAASRLVVYEPIGQRSASGRRSGPEHERWIRAPNGKTIAGIAAGKLTIYRLPAE